jgi:hypothetical protein
VPFSHCLASLHRLSFHQGTWKIVKVITMTMTKMKEKTFLEGDNSAIDKELERVSVPDPNLEQNPPFY